MYIIYLYDVLVKSIIFFRHNSLALFKSTIKDLPKIIGINNFRKIVLINNLSMSINT